MPPYENGKQGIRSSSVICEMTYPRIMHRMQNIVK